MFSPRRWAELQTWSHRETPCGGDSWWRWRGGWGYLWRLQGPGVDPQKRAAHHAATPLLWAPSGVQAHAGMCTFINASWSPTHQWLRFKAGCVYEPGAWLAVWWLEAADQQPKHQPKHHIQQMSINQTISDWYFHHEKEAQAVTQDRHTQQTHRVTFSLQAINRKVFCAP